jgi:hypothetical protein
MAVMTPLMRKILQDKRQGRADQAARPFAEKIAVLEKMRERHALIANSPLCQRAPSHPAKPAAFRF